MRDIYNLLLRLEKKKKTNTIANKNNLKGSCGLKENKGRNADFYKKIFRGA